ncbi:MAG: nickel pincer cofactor biosynthesis protein LarB [Candidatus Anammoximicrobium sp.]|nr:nickel pincer cofactor biosynthesis protein LarB [Candidatus Anammoximicrobium sp.]
MHTADLQRCAEQLAAGTLSVDEFVRTVARPLSAPLGEVTLDLDRAQRCGFPEVVYGEGKSVDTLLKIFRRLLDENIAVLATRIDTQKADKLAAAYPAGRYNATARTFRVAAPEAAAVTETTPAGRVAVVTAGSSDLPVAEEARETLEWMGVEVIMIHDVGVAGPHRLPAHLDKLQSVDAVVVVAGMEGALPSVVGGWVDCPVVAVPTSVGYGASFGGLAALLGMLNSCASNVTVVNIDAGFKAAYVAGLIAHNRRRPR